VVRDQVRDKLDFVFEDRGEQQVKNIARPVRVFEVRTAAKGPTMTPDLPAAAPPPLPEKPSIAVLPFQNLSGDTEQEYFADGIVEDIITALSRNRTFFVISRNTTLDRPSMSPESRANSASAMCSKAACGAPAIGCGSPLS
jgi:adenylate cyclase